MTRLIDANRLLKGKTDHDMISTHLIYNAPTVDAIPRECIEQMVEEIRQEHEDNFAREDFDTAYGLSRALDIIHKYTNASENSGQYDTFIKEQTE